MNLLDNTPNQRPRSKTKNWVEINDDARGMYNTNTQIKLKTSMLKSSCDYGDTHILVKGTILIALVPSLTANTNNNKKKKSCIQKLCSIY